MFLEILGVIALLGGLFFCAIGVLGVFRLPDTPTRLHASGKVATLGLFGLLIGAFIMIDSARLRILALGLFILMTSPVATHAIAAAHYRRQQIYDELKKMQAAESDVPAPDEDVLPQEAADVVASDLRVSPQREASDALATDMQDPAQTEAADAPATDVNVSAFLSVQRIQDIIEAQERAQRSRKAAEKAENSEDSAGS